MADNKPAYTVSSVTVPAIVKFVEGPDTNYSPVFGNQTTLIAGLQVAQVLVSSPAAGGLVWKNALECSWERFEAPA